MRYPLRLSTGSIGSLLSTTAGAPLLWSIPAVQDFDTLSRLPNAEVYVAVHLRPRDPATGLERSFRLTSAPRLHTEPWEKPANAQHLARLLRSWSFSRRAVEAGRLLGSSSISNGSLLIEDYDGRLSEWADLDWSAATAEVRLGGRLRADGTAYPFSSYQPYFTGLVEDLVPVEGGGWEVRLAGRKRELSRPQVEAAYRCFGGAVHITKSDKATGKHTNDLPGVVLPGPLTLEWFGSIDMVPTTYAALLRLGTSVGLRVGADMRLRLWTSPTSYIQGPTPVTEGQAITVVGSIAANGTTATLMVGTSDRDLEVVATGELSAALAGSGQPILGEHVEGATTNATEITVWEARVLRIERTLEAARAAAAAPLEDAGESDDVLEAWKFEDGTGTSAAGEKGVCDLELTSGCTFVSSLEGDDTEAFPGGPLGQSKPDCWGVAGNIRLQLVDSQRGDYQWSQGASQDLARLRVGGAPMVPDEVLALPSGVIFDGSTRNITLPAGYSAHRFIPGQADPAVTGQQIDITGTASNNGTFTIRTSGVSKNGRLIRVVESLISEITSGASTIRTTPAAVQYSYDLATSTVRVPSPPIAELTADVVGRLTNGSTCLASELLGELLGAELDTSDMSFDPQVGLWIPVGASPTRLELADAVAASAFAWWVEAKGGGYRVATLRLPSGRPRAIIRPSAIVSIRAITTITPHDEVSAGYARTWQLQAPDGLTGSVPRAARELYSQPWRILRRSVPGVRARYPLAEAREMAETFLVRRRDVERWLELAAVIYSAKRRWFEISVAGLGLSALDLDDVAIAQHPDPTLGLQAGELVRLLSAEEDTAAGVATLEAFL